MEKSKKKVETKGVEAEEKIKELEVEQKGLVERISKMEVISVEFCQSAVSLIQEIKNERKKVKDFLGEIINPLKEQVKKWTARFKPGLDELDDAEASIKEEITKFQMAEEERRKKEEDKIRKQQEKKYAKQVEKAEKKEEDVPPPPPPVHVEKEKVSGLQMRKKWTFQIIDSKNIPREFNGVKLMTPDLVQIRKLINAGVREIPGVKIYEVSISAVGGGDGL